MEPAPSTDGQEMKNVSAVVAADEKKLRPPSEQAPKCPRCDSENTKFCYYNNYSLSQPRYFCKSCRRYWTKGGTLRNVPIGGGCRKKRRSAKQSLDRIDLLLQSSSASDQNLSYYNNAFSSFESSGSCGESLSMAFANLQKQCDGHRLGLGTTFGFDQQNFLQAPIFGSNPMTTSNVQYPDLGFLSSQTTEQISLSNNGLYENGGDQNYGHTQPLLPYEDLSLSFDLMSGGGAVKQDMCDTTDCRILREFPWQMGVVNSGGEGLGLPLENDHHINMINSNNLVFGSSSSSSQNSSVGSGFELVAGGIESWNNNSNSNNGNNMITHESASAPSWPNLINTSVLM